MKRIIQFFALLLALATAPFCLAQQTALIVVDLESGTVIARQGNTMTPYTPCSTFKVPLALMGFDSGILKSPGEPVIDYKEEYNASRVRKPLDPQAWLAESALWYSHLIVSDMGERQFRDYIYAFNYGNRDISGDPGEDNSLTRSWISSSLLISPEGQVAFLRKMLRHELPVSATAVEMTKASMPVFSAAHGWTVHGKTGSSFIDEKKALADKRQRIGWFVGWATRQTQTVVFAYLIVDGGNGLNARHTLLDQWPRYVR